MADTPNKTSKPVGSARPSAKQAKATVQEIKNRSDRRLKKRKQQRQLFLLAAVLTVLTVIIVIIAVSCSKGGSSDPTELASSVPVTGQTEEETNAENAAPTPAAEAVSAAGRGELGAVYTAEEYLASLTPGATAQPIQYLPVINNGPANAKRIAVTVDDLNEVGNLDRIMTIAQENNAKLTLFAIGSVVDMKTDLQEALRRADRMGYEIENHTYNHERELRVYSLDDEGMAEQIYKTQLAVNNALGVNYEMHFVRLPGGNGENDLRTHQYLIQLGGYKALVHWSYSGSNAKLSDIKSSLQNGYIYLFHCTDKDLQRLEEFIPYAVSQGYELVTMNELMGYEANRSSSQPYDRNVPEPHPFVYTEYVTIIKNAHKHMNQMYVIQLVQERLIDLGYLTGSAKVDGDYGSSSELATKLFQYYNGLEADGKCGPATQKLLFSSDAKNNPSPYVAGDESTYPSGGSELELFKNS